MFPFFLGWFGVDFFRYFGIIPKVENQNFSNNFVNAVNEKVLEKLYNFLEVFEGYHDKAYDLKDGKITIGYGSTNWLSPTGKIIRPVRMGDVITRDEAKRQVQYYFVNVFPLLNQKLITGSIQVLPEVLVGLLNFVYMSGPGALNSNYFVMSLAFANRNSDRKAVAEYVKNQYIGFLKVLRWNGGYCKIHKTVHTLKYQCYGLGWSRRMKAVMDVIEGNPKPKLWYDRNFNNKF